jgi:hypothetical protein
VILSRESVSVFLWDEFSGQFGNMYVCQPEESVDGRHAGGGETPGQVNLHVTSKGTLTCVGCMMICTVHMAVLCLHLLELRVFQCIIHFPIADNNVQKFCYFFPWVDDYDSVFYSTIKIPLCCHSICIDLHVEVPWA